MKKVNEEKKLEVNYLANIKYILLDIFDSGKKEITSTDVFEFLKNEFPDGEISHVDVNDILCELFVRGDIEQVKSDTSEYVWTFANKSVEENFEKIGKDNGKNKPKEVTNSEPVFKNKFAKMHNAETTEGPIVFWTIAPKHFKEDECKGLWIATSEEALEIFLFEKTLKSKEVKDLMMQLVDTDDAAGIKVKRNF